jgi:HEAT repeat protein
MDTSETDDLLRALADPNPDVAEEAAWSLWGNRSKHVTKALLAALADPDTPEGVRGVAASALAEAGDRSAVEPILDALRSVQHHDRNSCRFAAALGRLGDARAVQPLIDVISDPNIKEPTDVCYYAIEALGELGDSRAVEPLIRTLIHEDRYVRCYATQALGLLRDKRALLYLERLAEHGDEWIYDLGSIRDLAAEAIRRIQSAQP